MLKLQIIRDIFSDEGTLGTANLLNEKGEIIFSCYTLEPAGEPTKESNKNKPILAGLYNAGWHKRVNGKINPILWNDDTPISRQILIHTGNTIDDTLGCILLGTTRTPKRVINSKIAYDTFISHFAPPIVEKNKTPSVIFLVEIF